MNIRSSEGLLFIKSPVHNPEFTEFISKKSLPGYTQENFSYLVYYEFEDIESTYSSMDGGWVNFYLTTNTLFKINTKMTELLVSYKLPNKMFINPAFFRKHIIPILSKYIFRTLIFCSGKYFIRISFALLLLPQFLHL